MAQDGGVESGGANGLECGVLRRDRQEVALTQPGRGCDRASRDVFSRLPHALPNERRFDGEGASGRRSRLDDPESDSVRAAPAGDHPGAIGRAAVVGTGSDNLGHRVFHLNAAAPHDARHPGGGADRIRHQAFRILSVPVVAPFEGAAVHLAQPPGVGPALARWGIAGSKGRGRPGTCRILPLRLGRQPVGDPFPLAEPFAEGCRILPADPCQVGGKLAAIDDVRLKLPVLLDRHLRLGDPEPPAEPYIVHRAFIPVRLRRVEERSAQAGRNRLVVPHPEAPRRHLNHPHPQRIDRRRSRRDGRGRQSLLSLPISRQHQPGQNCRPNQPHQKEMPHDPLLPVHSSIPPRFSAPSVGGQSRPAKRPGRSARPSRGGSPPGTEIAGSIRARSSSHHPWSCRPESRAPRTD